MRILTYAILGLLENENLTGYDIQNAFKGDLGEFWSTTHSRIYPELKMLTDEGFIAYETVIQGNVMEKKLYTITQSGRDVLHNWLLEETSLSETNKDEFVLKTFFCSSLSKDEKLCIFNNQLKNKEEKLNRLIERLKQFPEEITEAKVYIDSPEFANYLVLKRAIGREQSYINWLKESLSVFVK